MELSGTLPLSWLTSTEKWPPDMAERLENLMVEHQLFVVLKFDKKNLEKLRQVVLELRTFFDSQTWDPTIHDRLLQHKIKHKVNRIRASLVERGIVHKAADGFILRQGRKRTREDEEEEDDDELDDPELDHTFSTIMQWNKRRRYILVERLIRQLDARSATLLLVEQVHILVTSSVTSTDALLPGLSS